jgi:hypothetical protein
MKFTRQDRDEMRSWNKQELDVHADAAAANASASANSGDKENAAYWADRAMAARRTSTRK